MTVGRAAIDASEPTADRNKEDMMTASKQFLRIAGVKARTGMSRTAIYREIAAGKFPKQFSIGPNTVAWDSDEIDQWQQAKLEESRASTATSKCGA